MATRKTSGSRRTSSKLVLGTAQLGLAYGIAREHSPDRNESIEIIKKAVAGGVRFLDTANAYGCSEDIIGEALAGCNHNNCRVVTKLSPLCGVDEDVNEPAVKSLVEEGLHQSMRALRQPALDTVLLHRAAHIHMWNGVVFDVLQKWKASGLISSIGASVQSNEELASVLEINQVSHIQMPYNILDHRWDAAVEQIKAAKQNRDLTIHIRSIFLQGLMMTNQLSLWRQAQVHDPTPILDWLKSLCQTHSRPDVASLCISWALGLDWVNGIIIGCDNLSQLSQNLQQFEEEALSQEQVDQIHSTRPVLAEQTLNPAFWLNRV